MLKIRRPLGRLIFNMGIAIPGKTVFLIETALRMPGITVIMQTRSLQTYYDIPGSNYLTDKITSLYIKILQSHILPHDHGVRVSISHQITDNIWVRSQRCGCFVTWFCYQLIAKPGNKPSHFHDVTRMVNETEIF